MLNKKPENHISPHEHYKNMADEAIILQIFELIENDPRASQQKIIKQTGVATGLAHSFMKRVISRGWVKAKQVSAKRWLYFLTIDGFMEKARLSMNYLSRTMNTYKSIQVVVRHELSNCIENKWFNIIVAGNTEISEIITLNVKASDSLNLVGIVAKDSEVESMEGSDIHPLSAIDTLSYDRILVCDAEMMPYFKGFDKAILIDIVSLLSVESMTKALEESI